MDKKTEGPHSSKFIQLEAARGIASIAVIFHHFSLAFTPTLREPVQHGGLMYTPAFDLINGAAAVTFFFMLSGFVLTHRFYQVPSALGLTRAVIKRLPRLLVPASITILIGWAIFAYEPHFYVAAAIESHSSWLADFGNSRIPADFLPSIGSALKEFLLVFLLPHQFYYNSNLWTMYDEFYGSLLVFALSGISIFGLRNSRVSIIALHAVLGVISYHFNAPLMTAFILGSAMAFYHAGRTMMPPVPKTLMWVAVVIAILGASLDRWLGNLLSAFCVMGILLFSSSATASLSGKVGATLGKLSFPIYLTHTLVILGVSTWAYTRFTDHIGSVRLATALTLVVTLAATAVLCLPIMVVEEAWVPYLNKCMRRLIPEAILTRKDSSTEAVQATK